MIILNLIFKHWLLTAIERILKHVMSGVKYISRAVFFLMAVSLLVYLNRAGDNSVTIAQFKFNTIEKIRKDSLDSKHKLDLLLNETTKYIDDSSRVRDGIRYLMGLLGLWAAIEFAFLILEKRNYKRQEFK